MEGTLRVKRNLMSDIEVAVLSSLQQKKVVQNEGVSDISEIASTIGIRSNEEVQRALYVLEGRSLVSPEPKGDLTSNQWSITSIGEQALFLLVSGH